ncbi:hypothetical protein [Brachybacterium tyrofermentans]|uniref:hypothetical protein n=1 Tax=Brachybacterium tyrofermentans TaxID=47848 RepID=UPI003F8E9C8B
MYAGVAPGLCAGLGALRDRVLQRPRVLDGAQTLPPGEPPDLSALPRTILDTGGAELFRDSILDGATRRGSAPPAPRSSWLRRVIVADI